MAEEPSTQPAADGEQPAVAAGCRSRLPQPASSRRPLAASSRMLLRRLRRLRRLRQRLTAMSRLPASSRLPQPASSWRPLAASSSPPLKARSKAHRIWSSGCKDRFGTWASAPRPHRRRRDACGGQHGGLFGHPVRSDRSD